MFVARIHNNSLGKCVEVSSWDEGVETLKKMVKEQFPDYTLTEDDLAVIENDGEWHSEDNPETDDADNNYCFAIGEIESEY